jgi:hypothetical protein
VTDTVPTPDYAPRGDGNSHDTVLLEWTAKTPGAATYDGDKPRELLRLQQPFSNHNGGLVAFNPLSQAGQADFGMLYVGNADGGVARSDEHGTEHGIAVREDPAH